MGRLQVEQTWFLNKVKRKRQGDKRLKFWFERWKMDELLNLMLNDTWVQVHSKVILVLLISLFTNSTNFILMGFQKFAFMNQQKINQKELFSFFTMFECIPRNSRTRFSNLQKMVTKYLAMIYKIMGYHLALLKVI